MAQWKMEKRGKTYYARMQVNTRDRTTNKRVSLHTGDKALAKKIITSWNRTSTEVVISSDPHCLSVRDALHRSAETRTWTEQSRAGDAASARYFVEWATDCGFQFWHELRFEHVEQYRQALQSRRLAPDTIRLYLVPLRRTARWMAANWPNHYSDICSALRFSRRDVTSATLDRNSGNPYMPVARVLDFLDHLAESGSCESILLGVALQALAGLQLQEALRITWDKVNHDDRTITIDGEVKNRYRIREIPVCSVVAWLLARVQQAGPTDGRIVSAYSRYDSYSPAVSRALHEFDPEIVLKPKDFRNTLQTAAIDAGWYGYYVQRYVGHAPSTVGERHYFGDQPHRLLPLFREKVVTHIEDEISQWQAPDGTPVLPARQS